MKIKNSKIIKFKKIMFKCKFKIIRPVENDSLYIYRKFKILLQ